MDQERQASTSNECPNCHRTFTRMATHRAACDRKTAERERDRLFEQEMEARRSAIPSEPPRTAARIKPWEISGTRRQPAEPPVFLHMSVDQPQLDTCPSHGEPPPNSAAPPIPRVPILAHQRDDIRTEYHPHSQRQTKISSFEDYRECDVPQGFLLPHDAHPWQPFTSRIDFEFSEFALNAALNKQQTEKMMELMHRYGKAQENFTLKTHKEMCDVWNKASDKLAPFATHHITAHQNDKPRTFEFWYRSLWDWVSDLVTNPLLVPYLEWDAQRLSKFDGSEFRRFLHEPWTANRFWDLQSALPETGKPICIILYADQSKLSSFGSEKGYPIIARLGNLPAEIRNGQGLGGGVVVGWLPVVGEDEDDKGKASSVNFKRVVWHACFRQLLGTIKLHSKTGRWQKCGDSIIRHLFPLIYILAADYEEQCVMALIRGFRGLCPCPICLVPKEHLSDLTKHWPLRNMQETKLAVQEAQATETLVAREEILKPLGLRMVENAFWDIELSDPFQAISWDRMHSYSHGLGGKHLWPVLQEHIKVLGRDMLRLVDDQAFGLPRWRNLNHFDKILNIAFSDASKYEDILKISLFVTHNVISQESSPGGYLLLCCLRSYLSLDAITAMEVHTEETISQGRSELTRFSGHLKKYIAATKNSPQFKKNWNFPKNHTHIHVFDDILDKGATRNFSTKPGESAHGPIRKWYKQRTNFKNVAGQILKADHWKYVATYVRSQMDYLDDLGKLPQDEVKDGEVAEAPPPSELWPNNISIGAPQKLQQFQAFEVSFGKLPHFKDFYKRLLRFLSTALPVEKISLKQSIADTLPKQSKFTEYRFIKIYYESKVTCKMDTDYLRCSPRFNGQPRYDCVAINTTSGMLFAQLRLIFTIVLDGISYPLALIHPFDRNPVVPAATKRKDKDLGFYRLQRKANTQTRFIFARSIIRGAFIVPALDREDEFLVFDIIDTDMFLRMQADP